MRQRIAVIGNGNVGNALQKGAERANYETRISGADPDAVRAAGKWGEIIILAVPGTAGLDAIKSLGDVKGKTLVDPTSLLNQDWTYAGDVNKRGAEPVQEWAPGARVVKAASS